MERKLNEGIQELLSSGSSIPDVNSILTSGKSGKKKRTSIFDEVTQDLPVVTKPTIPEFINNDIVIPKSIESEYKEKIISEISTINKTDELKRIAEIRANKKNKTVSISIENLQKQNDIVKQDLEAIRGDVLPENVNFVKVEEDLNSALIEIPNGDTINIADVDIKASKTRKDKTGYFKTKVSIKKDNIPEQIIAISSYIKKRSNGLISPRICDLRVIGNTNKTQLRGSAIKLSLATVVFKPDFAKLKVNKGTRFMLSVPENYAETGNIIVFLQESRNKKILELQSKDFPSGDSFNAFIGDCIAQYYIQGYDVTLKKLQLQSVDNPLMKLITEIVGTHEFKAKPILEEDRIISVDFYSKGTSNQWLYINVAETDIQGLYVVTAKNTVNDWWKYDLSKKPITLNVLVKNLYNILGTCYDRIWDKELNIDEDETFYYLYDKISHAKLKNAMVYLYELMEKPQEASENEFDDIVPVDLGIIIKETLSKKDTAKALKVDYDAESVIGKTKFIDYYILTYLAFPIVGGDKRKGADYITTQEYYQKYNVKDKRDYPEREKTILKKEGAERNYNSRIYLFQLEYSVKGVKTIYRNKNWNELLSETGIFTPNPLFPTTKY